MKLSATALMRIQKETDWSKPTATADMEKSIRKLALEYVNGYLEGGNSRLAQYRDAERPTFVADEFAAMVNRMPSLSEYLTDLKGYLLDYPKVTLPNAQSFLYWQDAKFGLKPTIRINHLTIADEQTHTTVVSKMLYASHYFWTALELRVLVPDPSRGEGFWFVNVNQSRSDGLNGFKGTVIRGKVRGEAEKGMQSALKITKTIFVPGARASGRERNTPQRPCSSPTVAMAGWRQPGRAMLARSGATWWPTPGFHRAQRRRPRTCAGSATDFSAGSSGISGWSSGRTFADDLRNKNERCRC